MHYARDGRPTAIVGLLLGIMLVLAGLMIQPSTAHGASPENDQQNGRAKSFYLSAHEGTLPGHESLGQVPLLAGQVDGHTQDDLFVPLADLAELGNPDSVPVATANTRTWYSAAPFGETQVIQGESIVRLGLGIAVEPAARILVELVKLEPKQTPTVLAEATLAAPIAALAPQEVAVGLATAGIVLPDGAHLGLRISIEGVAIVHTLRYGSQEAPSGIDRMVLQVLDSDFDGLSDTRERRLGTDPFDADTDGDRVRDGAEVQRGSDPLLADAPGGKGHERTANDADGDGLPDDVEMRLQTDPQVADTDSDGIGDGVEVHEGSDPVDYHDAPQDSDGDGLPDHTERRLNLDPYSADTDNDGVSDGDADPDGDRLSNMREIAWGTNPYHADTDLDSVMDGAEVQAGRDPLVPQANVLPAGSGTRAVGVGMVLSWLGAVIWVSARRWVS